MGSSASGSTLLFSKETIIDTPEEQAIAAAQDVASYRAKWQWDDAFSCVSFYVQDRAWLDVVACYPRAHAKDWMKDTGGSGMHSFSFALHGEFVAHLLAREWCKKLEYYFDLWINDPNDEHDVGAHAPFVHSSTFWGALDDLPTDGESFKRYQELVEWLPQY